MILKAEDFKLSSFFQNQSESELSVPDFQRSYSWGIDQVKEFWEDLDSIKNKPGIHYLGAFIFVRTDDNNLNILDGQQRITTIFLFLYSIQNVLLHISLFSFCLHIAKSITEKTKAKQLKGIY